MTDKLKKEVSKQKWAILVAVSAISVIWGFVMYLEYKISQNKSLKNYIKLEHDLCLYVPENCQSTNSNDGLSFYCQTGTAGELFFDKKEEFHESSSHEFIQKVIKGKLSNYYLEVKVNEGKDKDLGKVFICP